MIEIFIQFSIDSDECKGVIRIPTAKLSGNQRVSSGSFQWIPNALVDPCPTLLAPLWIEIFSHKFRLEIQK
jgi:hypothetical protein